MATDVFFLIEHKNRELSQVKMIAQKLKDDWNISSQIFSTFFHMNRLLFMPKPKAIIVPFGMAEHIWPMNFLKMLYGDSVHFIHLSWEQYLFASNKVYKAPRDAFMKEQFHYLAWEGFFKDWLVDEGVPASNIHICGNPNVEKMELMEQDVSTLKSKLSQVYDFDAYDKTVYFPLNYAWSFLSDRAIDARIRQGYDKNDARAYRNYSIKSREAFIPFLIEIVMQNPRTGFIIRPHPGVHINQYKALFDHAGIDIPSNLHFINEFSAHEWVLLSDVIGSSVSTMCYDAYLLGKPSFFFAPFPHPPCLETEFLNIPPRLKTADKFNAFLEKTQPEKTVMSALRHSDQVAKAISQVLKTKPLSAKVQSVSITERCKIIFFIARLTLAAILSPYLKKFQHLQVDKFSSLRF